MGIALGNRRARRATVVLAGFLALSACSGGGTTDNSNEAPEEVELVVETPEAAGEVDSVAWGLYAEPQSLDYAYSYDLPPNTVISNVCESLLRIGPDFAVEPNIAESVDHPDDLTYVYEIREGVQFHSGGTVTADDVVFSLNRHVDPDVGSYWGALFSNVESIEKTGPMQVTMKLLRPDAVINDLMAVVPGIVESEEFVTAAGDDYGSPKGGVDCTGPFSVAEWDTGSSITLERFDEYWDEDRRALASEFSFKFIQDPAARSNALLSGELDGMYDVPPQSLSRLEQSGVGKLFYGRQTSQASLIVGNLEGSLRDVRIRRALSLAIDREGYIEAALKGQGEPSKSFVSKLTWGTGPASQVYAEAYEALPSVEQDIEAATALVEEAGAPDSPIVLAVNASATNQGLLATEVEAAGERIGLDVEVRSLPADSYGALFGSAEAREGVDLFYTSFYADIASPLEIYYQTFTSTAFSNYAGWKSKEYDRLIRQALAQTDPVEQAEITVKAQEIAVEELLWIPIALNDNSVFMNNRITGAPATNAYLYFPWANLVGASAG
ncbi:MAG: Oligopeptide ABC transporter, periplasmic oligopeptide-binding protein OppA [uncultured Nocardioidaceae bacterium]|uniref:Oligopeptide ABC transporter, periplasmic oligopeptide-binding protein OppA n=1 Tax=uncultured Nocardioidaceae bacterium TaxID=253824 RepID=A0A6J4L8D6_9ACTN|nr:MAG: Oligopeptide ABC transporter, periplasmic oligopeptide-binding protein OppA [uncultured Nocardioidaceae bacterium]